MKSTLRKSRLFAAAASLAALHTPLPAQENDDAPAWIEGAMEGLERGEEAVIDGRSVITIALEEDHESEVALGFDLIRAKKPDEAITLFEQVIADYEAKHAGQIVYCADSLEQAAIVWLETDDDTSSTSTIVGRNWCDAIFGKGFALIDFERRDEALPYLERAVKMAPLNAHYANEHAEWYKAKRDWQKSYELFSRAYELSKGGLVEIAPKVVARSLRGMGYNMIELGHLKQAREHFNKSLEVEPDNPIALFELSYIDELEAD